MELSFLDLLSFGNQGYGGLLVSGFWVTLRIALLSFAGSLLFGLLLSVGASTQWWVAQAFWRAYASVFMGVPSILVVFIFYYNGPVIFSAILRPLGVGEIVVTPYVAAITGLCVVYAPYLAEIFRSAVSNVGRGQFDAARALALPPILIWWKIVLPQVWRLSLPGVTNVWMVLVKDTALVSLVGLTDIVRVADVASGVTKRPFLFYVVTGFVFVLVNWLTVNLAAALERRSNRYFAPRSKSSGPS